MTGLQGVAHGISKSLQAAAGQIIMVGAMMVQEFVKSSIAVATEFELAMVRVMTISGATGAQFSMLNEKVEELGMSTMFTRQEMAEAAKQMAMAGLSAEGIVAGLEPITGLAEVIGSDVGRVAEVVTDLGLAFRKNIEIMENVARVTDVLDATLTSSAVNFEQLTQAMTYTSSTASILGVDIADVAGAIGQLGSLGLKGTKAGTSLNRAMQSIIAPTAGARAVMDELGMSLNATTLQSQGFVGVVKELEDAGASASEIFKLFGIRGGRAIAALVNVGSKELAKLTKKIDESTGIVKEHQEAIHKTAAYTYKKWEASMESVKGEFGAWLNKGIIPLMKGLMTMGKAIAANIEVFKVLTLLTTVAIVRYTLLAKVTLASVAATWLHTKSLMSNAVIQATTNTVKVGSILITSTLTGANYALAASLGVVKAAMIALYGVMTAHPLGAILLVIGLVAGAIMAWSAAADKGTKSQKKLADQMVNVKKSLYDQAVGLSMLSNAEYMETEGLAEQVLALEARKEGLDINNAADALRIAKIDELIDVTKKLASNQGTYEQGIYDILKANQELIDMSDKQIQEFTVLATVYGSANKNLVEFMETVKGVHKDFVTVNNLVASLTGQIEANNMIIEENEARLENLRFENRKLIKTIFGLEQAYEALNDVMSLHTAQAEVVEAKIAIIENTLSNAAKAFEDAAQRGLTDWGSALITVGNSIDKTNTRITNFTADIKKNNYEIVLLEQSNKAILGSFDVERNYIMSLDNEVNRLTDSMGRLSEAQNINNIKIRKMRLAARKEGRDLTEEELAQIEEWSIANEEAAITNMEIQQRVGSISKRRAQEEIDLNGAIAAAQQENNEKLSILREENADDALKVQGLNIQLMDLEDQKIDYMVKKETAFNDFMYDNYEGIIREVEIMKDQLEDLETTGLDFALNLAVANYNLIESQNLFNEELRTTSDIIYDEIEKAEFENIMNLEPALKAATSAAKEFGKVLEEILVPLKDEGIQASLAIIAAGIATGAKPEDTTEDIIKRAQKKGEATAWQGTGWAGDQDYIAEVIRNWLDRGMSRESDDKLREQLRGKGALTYDEANDIIDRLKYERTGGGVRLAAGGVVDRHGGITATIGERGPEAVIPLGKDQPFDGSMGGTRGDVVGGGGTTNNITMNFYIQEVADLDDPAKMREIVKNMKKRLEMELRR